MEGEKVIKDYQKQVDDITKAALNGTTDATQFLEQARNLAQGWLHSAEEVKHHVAENVVTSFLSEGVTDGTHGVVIYRLFSIGYRMKS